MTRGRRIGEEFIRTAVPLAVVVSSGIMGERVGGWLRRIRPFGAPAVKAWHACLRTARSSAYLRRTATFLMQLSVLERN
jgi:hypothetical protein